MASGFIFSTIPFNISPVSMPVVPSTPGAIPLISLAFLSIKSGTYFFKCLVISMSFIAFGPIESAVVSMFPNPTTNIESYPFTNSFNCSAKILLIFSILCYNETQYHFA